MINKAITSTMKNLFLSILTLIIALPVFAQNYGDTPEIEEKCKRYLSLYREYRNQKLIDDAMKPWRQAVEICPGAAKTLYTDGVRFYRHMIDNAADEAIKELYIDSLMWIYDKRVEHYGEEGFVLGLKGVDMMRYRPDQAKDAEKVLRRSVSLQKFDTDAQVLSKFYQTIYELYRQGEADRSELMTEFMPVLNYIEYNIQNLEDSVQADRYVKARENLYTFFTKIADDCEQVVRIFQKKLDENPDDVEENEKVLKVLNEADCTDSDFFEQVATVVYQNSPTHDAAYSLGMRKLKNKEYAEAKRYFDQAVDLCTDGCTRLETYLLRSGQVSLIQGDNRGARSIASRILQKNPRSGDALILHGDAIAASSKACDDGKLGSKAVFWLAVDYYNRAKSVDPSVAAKADRQIKTYSRYFPDKETLFFQTISEGSVYEVACFGETTKARALVQ